MPDIKFWFSPGACSLAPHILLREIGVSFEAIETPVSQGAHLTEKFTLINAKNRVPVLALAGEVISELPAISKAISDLSPERHLMGVTSLDKVRVYEWLNWLSGTLHGQGFGCLWRPQRFSDDPETFNSIKARGRKTIIECFDVIEGKLASSNTTGGGFTVVDPFLLVFYRWGNGIGMDMPALYPKYAAFANALAERESVIMALEAEHINVSGTTT